MSSGPGDGAATGARRKPRGRLHLLRGVEALAFCLALASVRCGGDGDEDDDGTGGKASLLAGTGGGAGAAGTTVSGAAGMAPATSGAAGSAGTPGSSGKGGAGTGGESGRGGADPSGGASAGRAGAVSAGQSGAASGGQSVGGFAGRGGGGRGGAPSGGRGGRGGSGGNAGASGAGATGTSGSNGSGGSAQSWDVAGTLDAHNEVRAMVMMGASLPALTWSDTLAAVAQDWADTLASECDGIRHRMPNDYGENIAARWFFGSGPAPNPARYGLEAVAAWAEEIECWTYGTISGTETCNQQCIQEQNSSGCGHYTQLVWRNTRQVGCGYATCDPPEGDLMEIFVCNYDPPGNYRGQAPY